LPIDIGQPAAARGKGTTCPCPRGEQASKTELSRNESVVGFAAPGERMERNVGNELLRKQSRPWRRYSLKTRQLRETSGRQNQTGETARLTEPGQAGDGSALVRGHILQLDGLRGLAILLVLVYHFTDQFEAHFGNFYESKETLVQALRKLFGAGWTGVDLFFVLSGFLITGILCDTKKSRNYFPSFYLRRFLRIFPLYYGYLFGLLVLLPWFWTAVSPKWEFFQEKQVWYWTYLSNWLCAIKGDFKFVPAGYMWSLAVEEQFYLIWPFVIYFLSRRALLFTCASLLLLSVTARFVLVVFGVPATSLYVMTCTHLDPLLVGALLALAFRMPGGIGKYVRLFPAVALFSVAGLIVLFVIQGKFKFWEVKTAAVGLLLLALLCGYVLNAALVSRKSSMLYKVLTTIPLRSFGRYSYAIYIFHPPIGDALVSHFDLPGFKGTPYSILVPFFCFIVVAISISWTVGFISWHLYEKHFLKLKKYCSASED